MLTFLCALNPGKGFDAEWVRKLRDAVARHMSLPHRFACLTDADVPCERIPTVHGWPGWWIKAEIFRPGVITGPTVFFDLDTVIVGPLEKFAELDADIAMVDLRKSGWRQLGAMFLKNPPSEPYDWFRRDPAHWMAYYEKHQRGQYVGDQALFKDSVGHKGIPDLCELLPGSIVSYKLHCRGKSAPPPAASVVCFHGRPRVNEVADSWVIEAWR